ncbi:MAG: DUF4126 domain-containing protein [Planctomycetota bacterium]|nr:DUF4126 domain-containing protein [Planctomycetota bacterium]
MEVVPEAPGWIPIIIATVLGIGLSAATGLKVFIPMLGAGIAMRLGVLEAPESFEWLDSTAALLTMGVACLVEVTATLVPVVDHAIDAVAAPLAAAGGAVLMAVQLSTQLGLGVPESVAGSEHVQEVVQMSPLLFWSLAIIVGGGAGLGMHSIMAGGRVVSTVGTAGLANPLYSVAETLGSLVATVGAILAPACCAAIAIPFLLLATLFIVRRSRKRRRVAALAAVAIEGAKLPDPR